MTCLDSNTYNGQTRDPNDCSCPKNFYDNATFDSCTSCPNNGCNTCDSTQCLTCLFNFTGANCDTCKGDRAGPNCLCPNKFYDDNSSTNCVACPFSDCKTCDSTKCLTCLNDLYSGDNCT